MQDVLGVVVTNLDLIMGGCVIDASMTGLVVALVMAMPSQSMAERGGDGDTP